MMEQVKPDEMECSVSIVQWTTTNRAMRITLSVALLKILGWNTETAVATEIRRGKVRMTSGAGNHLHQRGRSHSLTALTMRIPGFVTAGLVPSKVIRPAVIDGTVMFKLPPEFLAT